MPRLACLSLFAPMYLNLAAGKINIRHTSWRYTSLSIKLGDKNIEYLSESTLARNHNSPRPSTHTQLNVITAKRAVFEFQYGGRATHDFSWARSCHFDRLRGSIPSKISFSSQRSLIVSSEPFNQFTLKDRHLAFDQRNFSISYNWLQMVSIFERIYS